MAEINFIDYCKIFCSSGRGGHIILRADSQMWTLVHLKYRKHVRAKDGQRGGQHYATGKSAEDIILDVFINLYRVGQGILQKE